MVESKTHERFDDRDEFGVGSKRSFGFIFSVIFLIVGLWPLVSGDPPRVWSLIVASGFLLASLVAPSLLRPLHYLWMKFAFYLHKFVSAIVLRLIFYGVVLPTGITLRLMRKDPLNRAWDSDAKTYWVKREPSGPDPQSMKNQF